MENILFVQRKCVHLQSVSEHNEKDMDTQLVRLDAPYNIICGTNGKFALHIATLIVMKERMEGKPDGVPMADTLSVAAYPVVSERFRVGGQVWMSSELKDCYVVCEQGCKTIPLQELKYIMEFCSKYEVPRYKEMIPISFVTAMKRYGISISLPLGKNSKALTDFKVCLEFKESTDGKTCMVYEDGASGFYFYEYFANDPDAFAELPTNLEAINYMAELRDDYLRLFQHEGVRSITFTTKSKQYQWFVDKLNDSKADGEQV